MLGLDAAGKTTVQMRLADSDTGFLFPTIGFNVEHIIAGSLKFQIWDIGGQSSLRELWLQYLRETTHAVIFVVDSADHERLPEAKKELQKLFMKNVLKG